jgi:hypothetical protein
MAQRRRTSYRPNHTVPYGQTIALHDYSSTLLPLVMMKMPRKSLDTSFWGNHLQATDEQVEPSEHKQQNQEQQKEHARGTNFTVHEGGDYTGRSQTDDATDPIC